MALQILYWLNINFNIINIFYKKYIINYKKTKNLFI